MPVVIKRSESGASSTKPAKGTAKSAPAKGTGKAKQANAAGLSLQDQRLKIVGLCAIIALSLLFIAWWFGLFGGSEERHSLSQSTSLTTGASGTTSSPGTAVAPGATLGTPGAGIGAPAGGRMGGGVMPDNTGAAGARGSTSDSSSQGEGIP